MVIVVVVVVMVVLVVVVVVVVVAIVVVLVMVMVVVKVIVMVIAMVMVMVTDRGGAKRTSLPVFQPSSLPAFQPPPDGHGHAHGHGHGHGQGSSCAPHTRCGPLAIPRGPSYLHVPSCRRSRSSRSTREALVRPSPPPGEGAGRSGRSRLPERDAAAAVQQGPRVRVGRSSQGQDGRALRRLFRRVRRRPR